MPNFSLKALGFLARVSLMALSRAGPALGVFPQSAQLHPSQNRSAAKHSQYNLRHLERLQLQGDRLVGAPGAPFFKFSFPVDNGGGMGEGVFRIELGGEGLK